MPKPKHLFERPTRGERLADAMEDAAVRVAALNGYARRLKSLAATIQNITDRQVREVERCQEAFSQSLAGASPKKTSSLAKEAWPEFQSVSTAQDEETRQSARIMAEVLADLLEAL